MNEIKEYTEKVLEDIKHIDELRTNWQKEKKVT